MTRSDGQIDYAASAAVVVVVVVVVDESVLVLDWGEIAERGVDRGPVVGYLDVANTAARRWRWVAHDWVSMSSRLNEPNQASATAWDPPEPVAARQCWDIRVR